MWHRNKCCWKYSMLIHIDTYDHSYDCKIGKIGLTLCEIPWDICPYIYDWLIEFCFASHLRIFSSYFQWRAVKFGYCLNAYRHGAGGDLYHAILTMTQGLGLHGLIQRTTPFCHLLQSAKGTKGRTILFQILTGSV